MPLKQEMSNPKTECFTFKNSNGGIVANNIKKVYIVTEDKVEIFSIIFKEAMHG